MAGGGVVNHGGMKAAQYEVRVTVFVVFACIVAASGGLLFGYDIGISGLLMFTMWAYAQGVSPQWTTSFRYSSPSFTPRNTRAPSTKASTASTTTKASSFSRLPSTSPVTGRKVSMLIAGISFLVGSIINAAAANLAMLIIGRILLGFGVGFANQSVPLYLSELAPARLRGGLNIMFQLATTIGILAANLINYGMDKMHPNGWRLSLGLAEVPAMLLSCIALK